MARVQEVIEMRGLSRLILAGFVAAAVAVPAAGQKRSDDQIAPKSIELMQQARSLATAGRYDEAQTALEASLAVDPRYIPFGVPIWLDTTAPFPEGAGPLRRLVVAQDTGSAIKGVVRGDVFWGAGERAEAIAGHMKSRGRYAVLLPKALIPVS